jgi:hypothetical protein
MSLILERLVIAAWPLLTAVAGKKIKRRRAAEKRVRAALPRRALRKTSLRKRRGARPAGSSKGTLPQPTTLPPKFPEPEPPAPKPTPPTGRAILIAPENGKLVDTANPIFRWLSVGGATRYEVSWVAEDHGAGGHTLVSIATECAVPVEKPLRVGVMYQWRVRGGNEAGWGPWSPFSTFRVIEEPPSN